MVLRACGSRWDGTDQDTIERSRRWHGSSRSYLSRIHVGSHSRSNRNREVAHGGNLIMKLDAKIPSGPLAEKWDKHRIDMKLIGPGNKRKYSMIVVGSGLAGGSAAASLAELGYNVSCFCYQDTPRRAHSIAAQGGINASKNYQNDGDSVYRLFYDTIKGGDFRAREANVYRLAQVSAILSTNVSRRVFRSPVNTAAIWPIARSAAHRCRARFMLEVRPASSLLLGRLFGAFPPDRHGHGQDVQPDRNARSGCRRWSRQGHRRSRHGHWQDQFLLCRRRRSRDRRLRATSSTSRPMPKDATRPPSIAPTSSGAAFANPCFTQIHPTCIPVTGELPIETDTDVGITAQRRPHLGAQKAKATSAPPRRFRKTNATIISNASTPATATLRRVIFHRVAPRKSAMKDAAWAKPASASISISPTPSSVSAWRPIRERYGNLFEMYERITGENPYEVPMRIYPASHYTMGGLWVDYNLMSTYSGPARAR